MKLNVFLSKVGALIQKLMELKALLPILNTISQEKTVSLAFLWLECMKKR